MRTLVFGGLLLLTLAIGPSALAGELSGEGAVATGTWSQDRLSVGTRITHFVLVDEDDSSGFLGSIDHLGDEQDYAPYKVYADYLFTPYVGAELTWDTLAAVAKTSATDNHTDGTFEMAGPILTLFGRYPNESCCTPYAGLGAAFYQVDFDAESWWANGWASPQDYIDAGAPDGARNGRTRELNPDDAIGFVATAGAKFKFSDHWSADLYARYMNIESDVEFLLLTNGQVTDDKGTTTVPFDNYAFGAGLEYDF